MILFYHRRPVISLFTEKLSHAPLTVSAGAVFFIALNLITQTLL
jgi:hypothetical protein